MANFPTEQDDVIQDTPGSDTIDALGGDDTITVTTGLDTVHGGTGFYTLVIQYGDSTRGFSLRGPNFTSGPQADASGFTGSYTDDVGSGATRSTSFTGIDRFIITTGSGFDYVVTGPGDDSVSTGASNDFVDVGTGNDTADGGAGDDILSADLSRASSAIVFNLQTNSYSGPFGRFTNFEAFRILSTGSGDDVVVTTSLQGGDGTGNETLNLGAGNDSATVLAGVDIVNGGTGFDTLIVDYRARPVSSARIFCPAISPTDTAVRSGTMRAETGSTSPGSSGLRSRRAMAAPISLQAEEMTGSSPAPDRTESLRVAAPIS